MSLEGIDEAASTIQTFTPTVRESKGVCTACGKDSVV